MTYQLEFITPALLAGANQGRAELRVPSIRGELRWWFRVLGGTVEQERAVFGGIKRSRSEDDKVLSSSIIVRVAIEIEKHDFFHRGGAMSPYEYLAYFATVSGEKKGIRIDKDSFFAPGTKFNLYIQERRSLSPDNKKLLELSVLAFARLGSLGLRKTRCFGAMSNCGEIQNEEDFLKWCSDLPNIYCIPMDEVKYTDIIRCISALGAWLKDFRKTNKLLASGKSALGYSDGKEGVRESSALHLRPVRVKEGFIPLLVYTDKACSQESIQNLLI